MSLVGVEPREEARPGVDRLAAALDPHATVDHDDPGRSRAPGGRRAPGRARARSAPRAPRPPSGGRPASGCRPASRCRCRFQLCKSGSMTRARASAAAITTLTRRVARRRPLRDGSGRHELLRRSRRARRGGSRRRRSGRRQHRAEARARALRRALQRDLRHARRRRSRRPASPISPKAPARRSTRRRAIAMPPERASGLACRARLRRRHRARPAARRSTSQASRSTSSRSRPLAGPRRVLRGRLPLLGRPHLRRLGRVASISPAATGTRCSSPRACSPSAIPPETTVYPGHGPPTTLGAELRAQPVPRGAARVMREVRGAARNARHPPVRAAALALGHAHDGGGLRAPTATGRSRRRGSRTPT